MEKLLNRTVQVHPGPWRSLAPIKCARGTNQILEVPLSLTTKCAVAFKRNNNEGWCAVLSFKVYSCYPLYNQGLGSPQTPYMGLDAQNDLCNRNIYVNLSTWLHCVGINSGQLQQLMEQPSQLNHRLLDGSKFGNCCLVCWKQLFLGWCVV